MSSSEATATLLSNPVAILMSSTREEVGRIGRRDQQRRLVDEADRQRAVAARRVDRDQVRRRHVDLESGEVDVVEPVALGDGSARAGRRRSHPARAAGAPAGARRCAPLRSPAATRSSDANPSSTRTSVTNPVERARETGAVRPGRRSGHEGHRLRRRVTALGRASRLPGGGILLVRLGGVLDRARGLLDRAAAAPRPGGRLLGGLIRSVRAPARSSRLNREPAGDGRGDPGLPCSPQGW